MSQQPEQTPDGWMWPEIPGIPILDDRLDALSRFVLQETDMAFHDSFGEFHDFVHDEGWYATTFGNVVYEATRSAHGGLPELSIAAITAQQPCKRIVIRDIEVLSIGEGQPPRLELIREFRRMRNPLYTGQPDGCYFEKTIEDVPESAVRRFLEYNLPTLNILASWRRPHVSSGSVSDFMEIQGYSAAPLWWERSDAPATMHVIEIIDSPISEELALIEAFYSQMDSPTQ